jgi:hypothetical protein
MTHPLSAEEAKNDIRAKSHDTEDNNFHCPDPDEGHAMFCMIEGFCQTGSCKGT